MHQENLKKNLASWKMIPNSHREIWLHFFSYFQILYLIETLFWRYELWGINKQGGKSQEKSCFEKWFTMESKQFKDTSTESKEQVGNKQKAKQIRVRLAVHKPASYST